MDYLIKSKDNLLPETSQLWSSSGFKESGMWEEVFGSSEKCDEIFMGWHYARYMNEIAKAGKAEYPLPMFVNAWIVQRNISIPGDYPSGGPQAHMLDVWRAGELGAGQFFYAVGRHNSIGYSPFGFESRTSDVENDTMTRAYNVASSISPLILDAQEKGTLTAVLLNNETAGYEEVTLGDYKFLVELNRLVRQEEMSREGYCIIISLNPDEFIVYGNNVQISFSPATAGPAIAGIARADEGQYRNGVWVPGRRLNGDEIFLDLDLAKKALENKTGTDLKFGRKDSLLQRVKLYRYE